MIHETLSKIASGSGIPASRIGVPFLIDVIDALEAQGVTAEQSMVLGAFLLGSARGQVAAQAATN